MENLQIRQLNLDDEELFLSGLKDWEGNLEWYSFAWKEGMTHAEHIQQLQDEFHGRNLPSYWVAHTMLYGILEEKIAGRCSVRHRLNKSLKYCGGHIGYAVAPKYRKRGLGKQLLRAGLQHLKSVSEDTEALLTVAPSNTASVRMIEGAGGVLVMKGWTTGIKDEPTLYYQIDLSSF